MCSRFHADVVSSMHVKKKRGGGGLFGPAVAWVYMTPSSVTVGLMHTGAVCGV